MTDNPVRGMMTELRQVIGEIVKQLDERPLKDGITLTRQQAIMAQAALTNVCAMIAPASAVFDDAKQVG